MDTNGENFSLSASYTASTAISGAAASLELARAINAQGYFFAGEKSGDTFSPNRWHEQDLYAQEKDNIQSIQVAVEFVDVAIESEYQAILSGVDEITARAWLDVHFSCA